MNNDSLYNPYAPPATQPRARWNEQEGATLGSPYEHERRSVALLLVLTIVTLGIYPAIWFYRRRRFLDSLHSDQKLGVLASGPLLATFVSIGLSFAVVPAEADRGISVGLGVVSIVAAFRVAAILRSDFARTGRFLRVSGAGTFFFSALYLQHKINQAAATPARAPLE
jgi:hypothetical protein